MAAKHLDPEADCLGSNLDSGCVALGLLLDSSGPQFLTKMEIVIEYIS